MATPDTETALADPTRTVQKHPAKRLGRLAEKSVDLPQFGLTTDEGQSARPVNEARRLAHFQLIEAKHRRTVVRFDAARALEQKSFGNQETARVSRGRLDDFKYAPRRQRQRRSAPCPLRSPNRRSGRCRPQRIASRFSDPPSTLALGEKVPSRF